MTAIPAGHTAVVDDLRPSKTGPCPQGPARPFPTRSQPTTPGTQPATGSTPPAPSDRRTRPGSLTIDSPFAAVPEWVIDAQISDTALRLYCVLLRYGNTTGHRMPSRATLAARLHKKSTDTIDRALRELEALGALAVEHRATGTGRALTNRYHLLTSRPGIDGTDIDRRSGRGRKEAAPPRVAEPPRPATTPTPDEVDDRTDAAPTSRTGAARVAAPIVQDRQPSTQTSRHPSPSSTTEPEVDRAENPRPDDADARLLDACGIGDLRDLIRQLHDHRRRLARPITPWSRRRVLAALDAAVIHHGWPSTDAVRALLAIACDRTTTSPMRLTAPGPWWNELPAPAARDDRSASVPCLTSKPDPAIAERGIALARQVLRSRPMTIPTETINAQ